ncbi:hypothetical protein [Comamonas testosteroni]|uniref:hypothetical protein n=1 Tax=Comamonas testosteroni TaxID=285 RepID=UPI0026F2C2FE|nr:hypothetical protein [Comamonas testosteroni]
MILKGSAILYLSKDNEYFYVSLDAVSVEEECLYAFYLLRDGVRVDVKWYGKSKNIRFKNEGVGGRYQVKAFIKKAACEDNIEIIESEIIRQDGFFYDLRIFSAHDLYVLPLSSVENFIVNDGVYSFVEENKVMDVMISGAEGIQEGSTVLVCFTGAVTSRGEKTAPFFSGIGIAKKLGVPLISVADPSVSLSKNISLGWYAGHGKFCDFQNELCKFLESFANKFGVRFVIFGGSGGGFASLSCISRLKKSEAVAFVWNPQTSISKYSKEFVDVYLDNAFLIEKSDTSTYDKLNNAGVLHDLTVNYGLRNSNNSIIYFQNQSDWHTEYHAHPFIKKFDSLEKITNNIKLFNNSIYFEYNWGEGHVPPSEKIILHILQRLIERKKPLDIVLETEVILKNS